MGKIIGIDLGTTNSVGAVMVGGEAGRDPPLKVTPGPSVSRSIRTVNAWSAVWPATRPSPTRKTPSFNQTLHGSQIR